MLMVAHLLGGDTLHVVDLILYLLTGIGLVIGVLLFVSGRRRRQATPTHAHPTVVQPGTTIPLIGDTRRHEARRPPR